MSGGGESAVCRYRKRPVEVEALRYDGPGWVAGHGALKPWNAPEFEALRRFVGSAFTVQLVGSETHGGPNQYGPAIHTLEGVMRVSPDDFIIKGIKGRGPVRSRARWSDEFYPCKPDIFEATYELVDTGGHEP